MGTISKKEAVKRILDQCELRLEKDKKRIEETEKEIELYKTQNEKSCECDKQCECNSTDIKYTTVISKGVQNYVLDKIKEKISVFSFIKDDDGNNTIGIFDDSIENELRDFIEKNIWAEIIKYADGRFIFSGDVRRIFDVIAENILNEFNSEKDFKLCKIKKIGDKSGTENSALQFPSS
jgi:hypothetical protein